MRYVTLLSIAIEKESSKSNITTEHVDVSVTLFDQTNAW